MSVRSQYEYLIVMIMRARFITDSENHQYFEKKEFIAIT